MSRKKLVGMAFAIAIFIGAIYEIYRMKRKAKIKELFEGGGAE
jgi:flagellar biogenesis protein FliO